LQLTSLIDDKNQDGVGTGKDISDYFVAIYADNNIRFSKKSTVIASSVMI